MDHAHPHAAATATDPVCGMTVKTADAKNKARHDGHTYYFCSARCLGKFTAEPLRYLTPAAAAPTAAPAAKPGTIYTCPMHQQIRQVGPGSCPICGMALEPAEASARGAAERGAFGHDAAPVDRRARWPCRSWRSTWAGICSPSMRCCRTA